MNEGAGRGRSRGESSPSKPGERLLDAISEAELLGAFLVDRSGVIHQVNRAALRLVEARDDEQILGQKISVFFDPESREEAGGLIEQACDGQKGRAELDVVGREGGRRCLRCHLAPVATRGSDKVEAVVLAQDATEEILARRALEQSEERFRTFFESNLAASYICRADGELVNCNPAFVELFGFDTREEALATPVWDLFQEPADREAFLTIIRDEGSISLQESTYVRRNGESVFALESAVGSFGSGRDLQEITGYLIDITELRKKDEILTQLLFNDPLTDLPNRKLLRERLAHELDRQARSGEQVAMILVGLDRFKTVNQALGHSVGDRLLQEIGRLLTECIRRSDTVGRLSGDLFGVILPDIGREEDAASAAAKILELLTQSFEIDEHEVYSAASIGIALAPSDSNSADDLMNFAEMAMNRAKEEGGRKYKFFRQQMDMQILERQLLENSLRKAVERRELELHYQPQFSLETNRLEGVEALVRWRHPDMGLVFPGVFIGLAEETGLILQIGEWVLYEACRQAMEWRATSKNAPRISVNLSARQFRQRDLVETVAHALSSSGLPPSGLELEVTESVLMEDVESNIEKLERLRDLGIELAIDDFGTGYSSLIYLKKNFPVNTLKIDRGFLRDVTRSRDDGAIVEAILAMASTLRLRVVAEGVETEEQRSFLLNKECHLVQGFLFGRPVPAGDFEKNFLEK